MLQPSYDHPNCSAVRSDSAVFAQRSEKPTGVGGQAERDARDENREQLSVYAAWWAY